MGILFDLIKHVITVQEEVRIDLEKCHSMRNEDLHDQKKNEHENTKNIPQ